MHDFINGIPFVIIKETSFNVADIDKKQGYLYKFSSSAFNKVDEEGKEYVSSTSVVPLGMPEQYTPREILDNGVQLYIGSKESLHKIFDKISDIDKNIPHLQYEKQITKIILQAVKEKTLHHINQELNIKPKEFQPIDILPSLLQRKHVK